jgi:hypothetical protein
VAEKSAVHALPFAVEAIHPFSTFAIESIFGAGELPFAAKPGPGLMPWEVSASAEAIAAAFPKPFTFVALAPRFAPAEKNCESVYAAATVVTSFTTTWLDATT